MGNLQNLLGKNIRDARLRLQYSQHRLAELCGISPSFMGEIEAGKKFPSAEKLEKIAQVLGVKPYQLMLEEEDMEVLDPFRPYISLYQELKERIVTDLEETIRKYIPNG
ncbi:MAG: helix-turn-helix transcriptional regulator [Spirochaetales bacterium]